VAKRFTDTKKWDKAWFRKLPARLKCAWDYVTSTCDHAGIWEVDFDRLSFSVGEPVDEEEFLAAFGKHVVRSDGGSKYFVPSFLAFQYNVRADKPLNPENRVHRSVLERLAEAGVTDWTAYLVPNEAPCEPLQGILKPLLVGAKDKDKDQDKEQAKEKGKERDPAIDVAPLVAEWQKTLDHHKIPKRANADDHALYRAAQRWGAERVRAALAGFRAESRGPTYDPAANCYVGRLEGDKGELNGKLENAGYKVLQDEAEGTVSGDGAEWLDS
jgi:hypothetical protein